MIGDQNQGPIVETSSNNEFLSKTFLWMFLGLLGTAIVAWYTYSSGLYINIVNGNYFGVILILEVVVVLLFSLLFRKLSPTAVRNTVFYICSYKWFNFVYYICSI